MMNKKSKIILTVFTLILGLAIPMSFDMEVGENNKEETTKNLDNFFSEENIDNINNRYNTVEEINTASALPTVGNVTLLVLLCEFEDTPHQNSPLQFRNIWNGSANLNTTQILNENPFATINKSVREYYEEASFGKLKLNITVTDWIPYNRTRQEYIIESFDVDMAYQWSKEYLLDNEICDPEDFVYHYFIWSGKSTFDTPFWPHVGGIGARTGYGAELSSGGGSLPDNRGTACHELGHMFGLSDYYDTNYADDGEYWVNTATWDLMGGGGYNGNMEEEPAHHCLYSKMKLGWIGQNAIYSLKPGEIANLKIVPMEEGTGNQLETGYYYGASISLGTEQYMFEYRAPIGTDQYVPDSGLMWYQIYNNGLVRYIGSGFNGPYAAFYSSEPGSPESHQRSLYNTELNTKNTNAKERFFQYELTPIPGSVMLNGKVSAPEGISYAYDVLFDFETDFSDGWDKIDNVAANTDHTFEFNAQTAGEIFSFGWDLMPIDREYDPDEDITFDAANATFYYYNESTTTWDVILAYTNYYHDGFQYVFPEDGDYKVVITNNDDSESIDINYCARIFEQPDYEIEVESPEVAYMIGDKSEFEVDFTLKNLNQGWIDYANLVDGNLTVELPDGIYLDSESGSYNPVLDDPIFYNHAQSKILKVHANSIGEYNISVEFEHFEIYEKFNVTIVIMEDEEPPTFTLNKQITGNNLPLFLVSWSAFDEETGMGHYDFYVDDELVDQFFSAQVSAHEIPLPDQEGFYNITVEAFDLVNNSVTDSMIVAYDNSLPILLDIVGSSNNDQFLISFTVVETFSPPVEIRLFIGGIEYGRYNITSDEFSDYSIEITLENLNSLNITVQASTEVKFKVIDNLENSQFYYKSMGTLFGFNDEGDNPFDDGGKKGIPGYTGFLAITIISLGILFMTSNKKRQN